MNPEKNEFVYINPCFNKIIWPILSCSLLPSLTVQTSVLDKLQNIEKVNAESVIKDFNNRIKLVGIFLKKDQKLNKYKQERG